MSAAVPMRFVPAALLGLCLLGAEAAPAQVPLFYTVRPQGSGMRAAALAEALSADPTDVSGMYWNPAALMFLPHTGALLSHTVDVRTRSQSEHLAIGVPLGSSFAFGVAGLYAHSGRLELEDGSTIKLGARGADVAGAFAVIPTLSAGLFAGFRQFTFDSESRTAGWGQIGLFYYPSPGISYGLAYRVAREYTYWYANNQSGVDEEPELLQNLEIGATMIYPARAEHPVVMLSLTTEKSFPGVSLFSTKGGLEVFPARFLALRVGFKVGTLERVARYGIGLRFDRVHIDFAAGPTRAEQRFSGVSLMVNL